MKELISIIRCLKAVFFYINSIQNIPLKKIEKIFFFYEICLRLKSLKVWPQHLFIRNREWYLSVVHILLSMFNARSVRATVCSLWKSCMNFVEIFSSKVTITQVIYTGCGLAFMRYKVQYFFYLHTVGIPIYTNRSIAALAELQTTNLTGVLCTLEGI